MMPFLYAEQKLLDQPSIHAAMEKFVEQNEVAGAVTLVCDDKQILHLGSVGLADRENKIPMHDDALFWIASMTKPITGVAVMQCVEEGKISLDDPVEKYLPEFKELKNADGTHATVTIKQCLNHSSGLAELEKGEQEKLHKLSELTKIVATKPLVFPAGSKWQYCQTSINTAARIVEVVSGMEYPEYLEKKIFAPLGMKHTTFYPTKEQVKNIAVTYKKEDDGTLQKSVNFFLGEHISDTSRIPLANGGLFSTALDYSKFAQMLLNDGTLAGKQILKPESVKTFHSVQSGDLVTGFTPGNAWGVACCIVREPQGVSAALSPGSYGHGGVFGTQAWIDPVKNRAYILMIQRANIPNSDGSDIRKVSQDTAASSLK